MDHTFLDKRKVAGEPYIVNSWIDYYRLNYGKNPRSLYARTTRPIQASVETWFEIYDKFPELRSIILTEGGVPFELAYVANTLHPHMSGCREANRRFDRLQEVAPKFFFEHESISGLQMWSMDYAHAGILGSITRFRNG